MIKINFPQNLPKIGFEGITKAFIFPLIVFGSASAAAYYHVKTGAPPKEYYIMFGAEALRAGIVTFNVFIRKYNETQYYIVLVFSIILTIMFGAMISAEYVWFSGAWWKLQIVNLGILGGEYSLSLLFTGGSTKYRTKFKKALGKIERLKSKIKGQRSEIKALTDENKTKSDDVTRLDGELNAEKSKVSGLEQEVRELKEKGLKPESGRLLNHWLTLGHNYVVICSDCGSAHFPGRNQKSFSCDCGKLHKRTERNTIKKG